MYIFQCEWNFRTFQVDTNFLSVIFLTLEMKEKRLEFLLGQNRLANKGVDTHCSEKHVSLFDIFLVF